jgi:hypothetical protein
LILVKYRGQVLRVRLLPSAIKKQFEFMVDGRRLTLRFNMTAAGLFVVIPAVLAYNAFVRLNRLELMELDGFANDLYSFLNNGIKNSKKGGK